MVSLDLKYWQPANKKVLNKTTKPFNRLDLVGELPFCNFSIVNSNICLLIRAALQSAVCQDLYVLDPYKLAFTELHLSILLPANVQG